MTKKSNNFLLILAITLLASIFFSPVKAIAESCAANSQLGTVSYSVDIPQAGDYKVWVRIRPVSNTANTVNLEIDGTACLIAGNDGNLASNSWNWVDYGGQDNDRKSLVHTFATPGQHTVKVISYQEEVGVDRILLLAASDTCLPDNSLDTGNLPGDNCKTNSVAVTEENDEPATPAASIQKPASPIKKILLGVLVLLLIAGITYAGIRIWKKKHSKQMMVLIAAGLFVGIRTMTIFATAAESIFIAIDMHTGERTGNATIVEDASATGGKYIMFKKDAPKTTTTTTTTTTSTNTSDPPGSGTANPCSFTGKVPIETTDNAQSIVDANPAGTEYLIKAGVHQNNFNIVPKSGDKFCGEPGAIVDGGRTVTRAVSGNATNVTLDSFTVQNYNTGTQNGAIKPHGTIATGWILRNMTVKKNMYTGVNAATNMQILGGHYNENEQMGIGGSTDTFNISGVVLDGLDSNPATYDGPELAYNNNLHNSCLWEGGGIKLVGSNFIVRNVWAHDNVCFGIWMDINVTDTLIERNKIENNGFAGIHYEISQDGCIRNNVLTNNGHDPINNWYWGAGISIAGSFNVEVYGNTLTNNFNGIAGIQQDRPEHTPPEHDLDNLYVHNNTVSGSGLSGIIADNGDDLSLRDIVFENNTFSGGHTGYTDAGTGYGACAELGY